MRDRSFANNKIMYILLVVLLLALSFLGLMKVATYTGYVSVDAEAGYITEIEIIKEDCTSVWGAYYGMALMVFNYTIDSIVTPVNCTANLWHVLVNCMGASDNEVYASTVHPDQINFDNVVAATMQDINDYLNYTGTEFDSANKTFTYNLSVTLGTRKIYAPATYTKQLGNNKAKTPYNLLVLKSSNGTLIFVTKVARLGAGFSGVNINYQIMLPVSPDGAQDFYLYVDPYEECPAGFGFGTIGDAAYSGYVRDNTTNALMANVTVYIGSGYNITNAVGFFNFSAPGGDQNIVGLKDGYEPYVDLINASIGSSYEYNFSMVPLRTYLQNGIVTGYAFDNITLVPIANATVVVYGSNVTTNSSGGYTLSALEGTHNIVAIKAGYENYINELTIIANNITYHDISMRVFETKLSNGTLGGGVRNGGGVLLDNVSVTVAGTSYTTNSSGLYNMSLLEGIHYLVATKNGYDNYVNNVTIVAGFHTIHNITMTASEEGGDVNGTVIGTVINAKTNETISLVTVTISGLSDLSDINGSYNITVGQGSYKIVAVKSGYENYISDVSVTSGNITTHNISMTPFKTKLEGANLSGLVFNENGQLLEDVLVSISGSVSTSNSSGGYNMSVIEGTHNLVAIRSGYDNYFAEVNITGGIMNYHNVTMVTAIPLTTVTVSEKITIIIPKEKTKVQLLAPKKQGKLDYELMTKEIVRKIRIGSFLKVPIMIANYRASSVDIDIALEGDIINFISLDKTSMSIGQDLNEEFVVTIIANIKTGVYEGSIIIKGDIEETIPVTILVYDKERLPVEGLLIDLSVVSAEVNPGDVFKYKVDLKNLLREQEYSVNVTYKIQNDNSTEILIDGDIVDIQTSFSLLKSFEIPIDTEIGDYILIVEARYLGLISVQSSPFKITLPFYELSLFGIKVKYFLYGLFLAGIIGAGYFVYHKKKKSKQRYKIKLDTGSLPKEGERSAWVGNIAETNTKTYFDLDKFQIHTLLAGASGSGKSVVAQDLIEEALQKNVAVMVFDPTAQWSGFLRKCEDPKILQQYSQFGMKKKDARAFSGNIHLVTEGRELIDFKKFMVPGSITVFVIDKLKTSDQEIFVSNVIKQIFSQNLPEEQLLKYLLVYDGIHTLLPKYGGTGKVYIQFERAAREFRKWGVGLVLLSQVLSDIPKPVLANINTVLQLRTRDEKDLQKIKDEYGEDVLKSIVKAKTGASMVQNSAYNQGRPYFVQFRPPLHSLKRLSDKDLNSYEKYNQIVNNLDYQLEQLGEEKIDVFDLKLELNLAKDKVNSGSFNMVSIYLEGLTPRIKEQWTKLGKMPQKLEMQLVSEEEMEKDLESAEAANKEIIEEPKPEKKKKKESTDEKMKKELAEAMKARKELDKENQDLKIKQAQEVVQYGQLQKEMLKAKTAREAAENIINKSLEQISSLIDTANNHLDNDERMHAIDAYNTMQGLYSQIPLDYKKEIFNKCADLVKRFQ